jgi:hypothetical protein
MDVAALKTLGDSFAIFGFLALVIYFVNLKKRTTFENVLLAFCIGGLIADTFFTVYECK